MCLFHRNSSSQAPEMLLTLVLRVRDHTKISYRWFSTTGFEHITSVCAKRVLKQRAYVTVNVEMAYV